METMLERIVFSKLPTGDVLLARDDAVVGQISDEEAESLILKYEWLRSILVDIVWSEMLGPAVRAAREEPLKHGGPSLEGRKFNFSEVTKF